MVKSLSATSVGTAIGTVMEYLLQTFAILVSIWFYCVIVCISVALFPLIWWKEREERRQMRRLRRAGRVLKWAQAKARVSAGQGMFVASRAFPYGLAELWWIPASRESLDPDGDMPSFESTPSLKRIRHEQRRRLETYASSALYVEGRVDPEEVSKLPCVEDEWFGRVVLTGRVSDPLFWPTGDPAADAIRSGRDRLLDLKDEALNQAEYERATQLDGQVKALEQQLLKLTGQVAGGKT